jgi:glycosyltransferase involved in cell wall biosynthesis
VKITIAAWHLENPTVGIGRYVHGLIQGLASIESAHQYLILLPWRYRDLPVRPHLYYRVIRVPTFRRRVWEQLAPLVAGRYDLLHFPYDSCIAWKNGRFVVTIHDVKPLIFAEEGLRLPRRRLLERLLIPDPWSRIDQVITDSHCSKNDIVARLPVKADKVSVVYPGLDLARFRPREGHLHASAIRSRRPYVLCVAGADPTKNVVTLIKAFAALPPRVRAGHDLVLVGDFRRRPEVLAQVAETGIEKQTMLPGMVSDEELIRFYQEATLFVFPSLYEGFGYPVLEAMACGCPVISSNASSLPEVAGDAGLLVDPMDVSHLTHEIERVLSDATLRADLHARGVERASRFSWNRSIRELVMVYEHVGRG